MSNETKSVNMNWLGLLGVVFVVCKILGVAPVATWSWWLVLLPFYLGVAIFLGVLIVGAVIYASAVGGAKIIDDRARAKNNKQAEKEKVWNKLSDK